MYFRCSECLTSTWLETVRPVRPSEALTCGDCGRVHSARPVEGFGATIGECYRQIQSFSKANGIDMPTAYSVLLGILSPEELEFMRGTSAVDGERGADRPGPAAIEAASVLPEIDPAFQAAVDAGHLALRTAIERGDREVFALNLVHRHGLTREMACAVADNRISLRDALQQKPVEVEPERPPPAVSRRHTLAVLAVTLTVLGAVSWNLWSKNFERARDAPRAGTSAGSSEAAPAGRAPTPAAGRSVRPAPSVTEVRRNDDGQIVEIIGPDPGQVLLAFCGATHPEVGLEPLEITQTVPELHDRRLGLFRDFAALDKPFAIWIRKDWRTRRWVAGDGKGPIPVRVAPEIPEGGFRRPVVVR